MGLANNNPRLHAPGNFLQISLNSLLMWNMEEVFQVQIIKSGLRLKSFIIFDKNIFVALEPNLFVLLLQLLGTKNA